MERLDKLLAHAGWGSRREVRQLVRAGRVRVDGRAVKDPGQSLDPRQAQIEVDGSPVRLRRHLYLMLHKPAGVITATTDGRQATVLDLVPPEMRPAELHPVGRLDKETEGLLLLTTDGELTHRLLAPRRHVEKEYEALLDGPVTAEDVATFAEGLAIDGGEICRPAALSPGPDARRPRVVVVEGKYHQVRRMFRARGREVLYLKRLRMGPLTLDPNLPPGEVRELVPAEIRSLYAAAGLPVPAGWS